MDWQSTFPSITRVGYANHLTLNDLAPDYFALHGHAAWGMLVHLLSQITGFPPQVAPCYCPGNQDGHK